LEGITITNGNGGQSQGDTSQGVVKIVGNSEVVSEHGVDEFQSPDGGISFDIIRPCNGNASSRVSAVKSVD